MEKACSNCKLSFPEEDFVLVKVTKTGTSTEFDPSLQRAKNLVQYL